MAHHDLKIFDGSFQPLKAGIKTADVRFNDRNYQVGDSVTLRAGWPDLSAEGGFHFTGEEMSARITFITDYGCAQGYVCLSLGDINLLIVQ